MLMMWDRRELVNFWEWFGSNRFSWIIDCLPNTSWSFW